MNFSPFTGPFSGNIPAIHQYSSAAQAGSSQTPHHHSTTSAVNIPQYQTQLLGKLRGPDQPEMQHYGSAQQYGSIQDNNAGGKHLRLGNTNHSLAMGNVAYHQEQDPIHQPTNGHDSKRSLHASQAGTWQAPSSTVADYLSHLPASTLPLSLHHFLKYSAESIKKESNTSLTHSGDIGQHQPHIPANQSNLHHQSLEQSTNGNEDGPMSGGNKKKKKKKSSKAPKEKKPRPKPGEIRLTTALDGSTLFCCPECQMAYPERGLLEQHLVGHNLERRFICDICNAALKRKDHLTRHKQSHNPERPFVCNICMKAFKRKEQLTLHFVIHSGEKRHICNECGKGFYRKDHLRKHTRSHIARRVKAELSTSSSGGSPGTSVSLTVPNAHHQMQTNQH